MTEDWRFLFGYTNITVNGVILLMILFNLLVHKLQQLQEAEFVKKNKRFKSLSTRKLCYRFSIQEIQRATSNFDEDLVIGEGGFGKVYKGIFNPGPTVVAIKRLQSMSKQGSVEFRTEIEMLSKFRHSHLVSLIGYCDDGYEMILVYEFMPVGTLADHLHKRVRQGDTSMLPLSWIQRLKICIGAARGLDYLHTGTSTQHRVIHRDVKTTNILLDENLAAKIGDFGLSKITPTNQASIFVSSHVKGTFGYLDPYYFLTHRLTMKSDVYAFGVVLCEVLSGRPAIDLSLDEEQRGLAGWAKRCFRDGLLDLIIDPRIKGLAFHGSLDEFVKIALKCLENGPKDRPTMGEVVVCLESALVVQEQSMAHTLVDGSDVNLNQERMELSLENYMQKQKSKNYGSVANGGYLDATLLRTSSKMTKLNMVRAFTMRLFTGLQRRTNENKRINDNKRNEDLLKKVEDVAQRKSLKLRVFTLDELRRSTRFFETGMLLGGREYGRVYKGWVQGKTYTPSRHDVGTTIAVKRLGPKRSLEHSKWEVN
ncbi:hypothetical protein AgCh_002743 [Apium graveolens]